MASRRGRFFARKPMLRANWPVVYGNSSLDLCSEEV